MNKIGRNPRRDRLPHGYILLPIHHYQFQAVENKQTGLLGWSTPIGEVYSPETAASRFNDKGLLKVLD